MKIRTDGKCEMCGISLYGQLYEDTHTTQEHDFCGYECFESYYGGNIMDGEDFLNAKQGA